MPTHDAQSLLSGGSDAWPGHVVKPRPIRSGRTLALRNRDDFAYHCGYRIRLLGVQ